MLAYCGQILEVDLTSGRTRNIPISEELFKKYIGGSGLGAALYAEYTKNKGFKVEPLSPDNPLIFATGPLTGSALTGAARIEICSRSPLTNIWGETNAGGFWGPELKKAGYDAIVVIGVSSKPVSLCIDDGNVELIPADNLWGQDTYAAIDALSNRGKVISIGQAGENQVSVAAIAVGKHNFAARCGLGAVMGSKKLKAIAVKGTGKYKIADTEKMKELRGRLIKKAKAHPFVDFLSNVGTIGAIDGGPESGDCCIKNWQVGGGAWPKHKDIFGVTVFKEKYWDSKNTCHGCPVGCKQQLDTTDTPKYKVKAACPEYESGAAYGTTLMNNDAPSIAKCNDLSNRYGIDSISVGTTIAVAIECFEKGYITTKDTDGLELKWGDSELVIELVHQIAKNEGFGARLAKGSEAFVADLDPAASETLSTVKGLEAPFHEPRLLWGLGLDYATGVRGACHVTSTVMMVEFGFVDLPKLHGTGEYPPPTKEGKPEMVIRGQDFSAVFHGAACYCQFSALPFNEDDLTETLNATIGSDFTFDEIMEIGKRIWSLKRTLSNIWGIRKEDDTLPKRFLTPLKEGPVAGLVPPIDEMVEEYYQIRGMDECGFLKQEILEKLELPEELIKVANAERNAAVAFAD